MNEITLANCKQLIINRDRVKAVFPWDSGLIQLCCAGIYSTKGILVDEAVLEDSKKLIKERVGIFSNFRSTARSPIAAMIAVSENPEQTLENGLHIYNL